jgi:hypothetical protein
MDDAESTFSEVVEAGLQSSTHRYEALIQRHGEFKPRWNGEQLY